MTNIKNVQKYNALELERGITGTDSSWHHQYRDSAWIFVGGINYELTEGDVVCVFSQFGEIVNVNLGKLWIHRSLIVSDLYFDRYRKI